MIEIPPFSASLPGFRARTNEILKKRLDGDTTFTNYCVELSGVGKELIAESATNCSAYSTNGYPGIFVVVSGSLARDEATVVSDLDFLALPKDKSSESGAGTLLFGMNLTFQNSSDSPFRFDSKNNFSRFHHFCTAPENYPENLLVDQVPLFLGDVEVRDAVEDCGAHRPIRDFTFVSGDKDGFEALIQTCGPILYPSNDSEASTMGRKLIAQMVKDSLELIEDWEKEKTFREGIKESGIRLFQLFRLIIAARENIQDAKNFYKIMDRSNLEVQDADFLKNTFEKLLMTHEAKKLILEDFLKNPTLKTIVSNIKIEQLEQEVQKDFDRSIKIMRKYL